MLKGGFVSASPVTVKKGQSLLNAAVRIKVGASGSYEMSGLRTVVYLSVDELQVKTKDGVKVILGDENTTQPPTEDPYGPTGHCIVTDPVPSSHPDVTTVPMIATSSPVNPTNPDPQIVIGDLNGDGIVTVADATEVQRYLADLVTFTPSQRKAADTNGDVNVTINDATRIQMYAAELIDHLG